MVDQIEIHFHNTETKFIYGLHGIPGRSGGYAVAGFFPLISMFQGYEAGRHLSEYLQFWGYGGDTDRYNLSLNASGFLLWPA